MDIGLYQQIVNLITDIVFGGSLEGVVYGQLIVEGLAAFFTLLLVLMPFIFVWRVLKRFL